MAIIRKAGIIIFFVIVLLFLAKELALAQALELKYPSIPGAPLSEKPLLPEFIKYLYNFSIIIAGLVAFFSLVYGGFRYMISTGEPSAMADAREQVWAGFLGLLILLGSFLLLNIVNPQLTVLHLSKEAVPETQKCDCSTDILSALCQRFCEGIVIPTNVYKVLEVPIGTLIEEYVLNEDTFAVIKTEVEKTRALSETVKKKAEELQKLLQDNCSCGKTSPVCPVGCVGGNCVGDPCTNRLAINLKRLELREAYLALENQIIVLYPITASYKADVLRLLIARILMEEGLLPLNYDNLLEAKQTIVEAGGDVDIENLSILGKTIVGVQDSANLYFDAEVNKELIGELLLSLQSNIGPWETIGDGGWPPFHVPPGTKILIWPINSSSGCITQYYDTYRPELYAGGCHRAIDISASRGDPVLAARDGTVFAITDDGDSGLGLWVAIKHQYGGTTFYTVYGHLDRDRDNPTPVPVGNNVNQGDIIGYADNTGHSEGDHLDFRVMTGSVPWGVTYDPLSFLPSPPCTYELCGSSCHSDLCTPPEPPFLPPPGTGLCSPENLGVFGEHAGEASCICQAESGGNAWALNDGCLWGAYDYSVGLFQINLFRTGRCPGAFNEISVSTCSIRDAGTVSSCETNYGLGDPNKNIQRAYSDIFLGVGWCPWSTAPACGLCP